MSFAMFPKRKKTGTAYLLFYDLGIDVTQESWAGKARIALEDTYQTAKVAK